MIRDLSIEREIAEFKTRFINTAICCMDGCIEIVKGWGQLRICAPGTELFRQNKKANTVYFIETGIVKLSRLTESGTKRIIGFRTRKWLLELSAVLAGRPHSFTAITLTRCSLRTVDAGKFLIQMDQDPEFRRRIECVLSTEIQNYLQKFEILGSLPAETRLKHLLLELMTAQSESISREPFILEMPIKHLEMGEIIGITPEHLSRLLKKMENEQLIRRVENKLTILNPGNLIASTIG